MITIMQPKCGDTLRLESKDSFHLVDRADDDLFEKVLNNHMVTLFFVTFCLMKRYRIMDLERGVIVENF